MHTPEFPHELQLVVVPTVAPTHLFLKMRVVLRRDDSLISAQSARTKYSHVPLVVRIPNLMVRTGHGVGLDTFLQAMPTRPRAAPYEHFKFGARAHEHSGEEAAAIPWPLPRALRARGGRAAPGVIMKLAMAPRIWRTSCGYRKVRHPRSWPRRRWAQHQPRAAVGSTACLAEPVRH